MTQLPIQQLPSTASVSGQPVALEQPQIPAQEQTDEAAHWIQKADIHKGAFSKKATAAGMSVAAYAAKVLAPGSTASATTKKQAQLAKNFAGMHHHKSGGKGKK